MRGLSEPNTPPSQRLCLVCVTPCARFDKARDSHWQARISSWPWWGSGNLHFQVRASDRLVAGPLLLLTPIRTRSFFQPSPLLFSNLVAQIYSGNRCNIVKAYTTPQRQAPRRLFILFSISLHQDCPSLSLSPQQRNFSCQKQQYDMVIASRSWW